MKYSLPLFTGDHITIELDNTYGPHKIQIDELVLEPVFETNVSELEELHTQSGQSESYIEFIRWDQTDAGLDEVKEFKNSAEDMWGSCFVYSLYLEDQLIGIAALALEDYTLRGDVGVWIKKSAWESYVDVASDTFSALTSVAFEVFDRKIVKGTVDSDDLYSIQSLQKSIVGLGGSFEGVFRQFKNDTESESYKPRHVIVYSVTLDEFYTIRKEPKSLNSAINETPMDEAYISSEI